MTRPKDNSGPMPRLDREWISAADACRYLDIGFTALRKLIDDGKLEASQLVKGGKIRIRVGSIDKLVESTRHTPTPKLRDNYVCSAPDAADSSPPHQDTGSAPRSAKKTAVPSRQRVTAARKDGFAGRKSSGVGSVAKKKR